MSMPKFVVIPLAFCVVASLNTAAAGESSPRGLTIKLPPETASFKPGAGSEIASANCQICHSADYVSTQPPSTTRAKWTEIVEKMQSTFGAPIQTKQIAPLVDYLVKNYGDKRDTEGVAGNAR